MPLEKCLKSYILESDKVIGFIYGNGFEGNIKCVRRRREGLHSKNVGINRRHSFYYVKKYAFLTGFILKKYERHALESHHQTKLPSFDRQLCLSSISPLYLL